MTGSPTTKKLKDGSKAVHYYYRCRNRECDGGGGGRINEKKANLEASFAAYLRSLSAPEGTAKLFAEILRDTLKKRHREVERARRRFAARRRALAEERAAITRGYGKGAFDEETTREQLDRNREEDRQLAQKEAELSRPLPDLEQLIPLAERVLADPAGLWEQAWGKQRTALQRFLLPLGVPYDGTAFGTALTAPIFEWLRPPAGAEGRMVTPRGFEPLQGDIPERDVTENGPATSSSATPEPAAPRGVQCGVSPSQDPALAELIRRWPALSEDVRRAIIALVQAARD